MQAGRSNLGDQQHSPSCKLPANVAPRKVLLQGQAVEEVSGHFRELQEAVFFSECPFFENSVLKLEQWEQARGRCSTLALC